MSNRHSRKPATGSNALCRGVLWLLLLMGLSAQAAFAQFPIHGTVYDTDGVPLPGVNVVEVGTQNGATTDANGEFDFTVSSPNASIIVSFIGYVSQTLPVNSQEEFAITLEEDVALLEEVVVTSFGIERRERAVGFAVSEVDGEDVRTTRENNVANALAGKVAGVLVQKPATGPAGSSRVVIRGATSLGAGDNNQPLYVVDGVPIDNSNLGNAGMWGGSDGGDGISSINPDDIENISVLKGPAAAALYGTRAKNGVILITTRKAQMGSGLGIEFNSNTTFETILTNTDWQTEYGQGSRGERPETADDARNTNLAAWGERLDGQPTVQWDGVQRPYSLVEDRLENFYNQGLTSTNSLALTTATQNASARFALSHLTNDGINPNSGLDRTTFTIRSTANLGSRLSADGKVNFIRETVSNRPRLSDAPGNANFTVYQLAPNVDPRFMKCLDGSDECPGEEGANADGTERSTTGSIFSQNPYWAAYQYREGEDEDRRLIGFFSLNYQFTEWLQLMGRFGGDTYTTRRTNVTPWGTGYSPQGGMSEQEFRISEINTDFLLIADRQVTSKVGVNATLGGNVLYQENETLTLSGSGGFNIPTLESVGNQANPRIGYGISEKQINSLYGSAEFSYSDYFFVTVTGRNDWSSTLPEENNSYFYPSVSGSFVFSDAFNTPDWITFGKLRASWAEVGGDTDPYNLNLTYSLAGAGHLGRPYGGVAQGTIPLADLKPQSSVGIEGGIDIRFFDNRFGVDFTLYEQTTTDQILSTTISSASGFGSRIINAGEMKNSGYELLVSTTPVRTPDVRWDVTFNFANNKNEVVSLAGEQTSLVLQESRRRGNFVTADVGEPYGTIKGQKYLRQNVPNDAEGNPDVCNATGPIVHDATGLPMRTGQLCVLGVGTPDVLGGVATELRYKRLTISGLVDMRFGGDLFSFTNSQAYGAGLHRATLEGREQGFIVGDGVLQDGSPNNIQVDPQDYFGRIASDIGEEFVYDASFVKLRELQVTYRLPDSWFGNTPVRLATLSLVGRNLWLIHSNIENVDPESTFRNDNAGPGLEHSGVPQTRSLGFNLNLRF